MSGARAGIEGTLYRYAWTYDMDELDDLEDCFTTDAEVTFRAGLRIGRAAVGSALRALHAKHEKGTVPWHVISNILITHEMAEEVKARSRFAFFLTAADGTTRFASFGWYDDVFVLEDGVWRISLRRVLTPHHR